MLLELLSAITTKMLYLILHIENAGSFPKPLSAKEEKKALEQMASGDTEAKNRLIEHNLRLVAHIIKKYYSNYSDQEDLISIGTIGLIKGINSFDYTKGTRLATYASRCIENEILMHFRIQSMGALGPAKAAMLIVISQLAVAYVIELFGLFGVDKEPFEWRKILGLLIAISGIIIFKWQK